nr:MAG TPA: hypothetical protein [Caudoviricetes sp.]
MKVLTTKKQRDIEYKRDIIFDYIRNNIGDNVKSMSDAVEALADISCNCGIWSNPADKYY